MGEIGTLITYRTCNVSHMQKFSFNLMLRSTLLKIFLHKILEFIKKKEEKINNTLKYRLINARSIKKMLKC